MVPGAQDSYLKAKEETKKSDLAAKARSKQWALAWAGDRHVISAISQSLPVVGDICPLLCGQKKMMSWQKHGKCKNSVWKDV